MCKICTLLFFPEIGEHISILARDKFSICKGKIRKVVSVLNYAMKTQVGSDL